MENVHGQKGGELNQEDEVPVAELKSVIGSDRFAPHKIDQSKATAGLLSDIALSPINLRS
jgi:hypothetical protein